MTSTAAATHTRRFAMAALLVGALLAPAVAVAEEAKSEEKTLADHMGVINDNYKKLRRSARTKEFNDESVKLVQEMVVAAQASKEMVPPMAEKLAGAEKDKFIEAYKKEMDGMIAELQALEKALTEKRADDAAKMIEKLNDLKKQGHDKFVEE